MSVCLSEHLTGELRVRLHNYFVTDEKHTVQHKY